MAELFNFFKKKKSVEDKEVITKTKQEVVDSRQGKFLVIEGNDGSGKKTQLDMLSDHLKKEGRLVEVIDFPDYNSFYGKLIKKYLDGEFGNNVNPYLIALAYANDRLAKKEQIDKWLSVGKIVLCNRYVASNKAHQAIKLKTPEEMQQFVKWIDEMEYDVNKLPRPDITIYLYVPSDIAISLIQQRAEKNKVKTDIHEILPYMNKVEVVYLGMAKNKNWVKIDCVTADNQILTKEEVHEKIYSVVKNLI